MSTISGELLCLKWNNHYSAFLKCLSNLHDDHQKELYCDATIACHGKYYPVHRFVLSTCSEYFEEIFEFKKCQHPFIIVKDIQPTELEALLNYMYKGEVNVTQELLPALIKAAEGLKIKGLAVPEDTPPKKTSTQNERKRSIPRSSPSPRPKKNKYLRETSKENSFHERKNNEDQDKVNSYQKDFDPGPTQSDPGPTQSENFQDKNELATATSKKEHDETINVKLEPNEPPEYIENSFGPDDQMYKTEFIPLNTFLSEEANEQPSDSQYLMPQSSVWENAYSNDGKEGEQQTLHQEKKVRGELSVEERARIVMLRSEGLTNRAIGKLLRVSHSTVIRTLQRFREQGNYKSRRAGRQRHLPYINNPKY